MTLTILFVIISAAKSCYQQTVSLARRVMTRFKCWCGEARVTTDTRSRGSLRSSLCVPWNVATNGPCDAKTDSWTQNGCAEIDLSSTGGSSLSNDVERNATPNLVEGSVDRSQRINKAAQNLCEHLDQATYLAVERGITSRSVVVLASMLKSLHYGRLLGR